MDPISVLLILLITAVIFLLFAVIWLLHRLERQRRSYYKILKATKNKAKDLMEEARLKAQETLLSAEQSAGRYLSERQTEINSIHNEFVKKLEGFSEETKRSFVESVQKVEGFSNDLLNEARVKMEASIDAASEEIKETLRLAKEGMDERMHRTSEDLLSVGNSVRQLDALNAEAKKAFAESAKSFYQLSNEMSEEARGNVESFSTQLQDLSNEAKTAFSENARKLNELSNEMSEEARGNVESFSTQLQDLSNEAQTAFSENARKLNELSNEMSEEAREHLKNSVAGAAGAIEAISEQSRERMGEEIDKMTKDISVVKAEISEMLKGAADKELEDLKKEMENYKKDRMRVVDEQIVTLVEETAQIALNTKLSHDDHREVVRNALDEAKKRGAFGQL